jgi:hypothetical protein
MKRAAKWLSGLAVVLAVLTGGLPPAAAEWQLVGFIDEQNVYMDTDRLQYFIDPQTNDLYYDVWTKNVYSEAGRADMIRKIKAMGQYTKDFDNLGHAMVHKYYRLDRGSFKDVGFVLLTKGDRILELGEVPPGKVAWEAIRPKSVEDSIYKRVKLYEDAYREKMIGRSLRDRYQVIGNNIKMTASVDTANAKFFRDPYSGNHYAEVWLRLDFSEEAALAMLKERREKGVPTKGWSYLGYMVDKSYYDFSQNRVLVNSMAFYTRQGALLESHDSPPESRSSWQQPIPESWGEHLFTQVRKFMTGE